MATLLLYDEHPIRLTERGQWRHGDADLHPRVARLFERNIHVLDPNTFEIRLDFRRAPLLVEDTAFFVRSLILESNAGQLSSLEAKISDGQREVLDPTGISLSDDHVFYVAVARNGHRVRARLSPQQCIELAEFVQPRADGVWLLTVDGEIRVGDAATGETQKV